MTGRSLTDRLLAVRTARSASPQPARPTERAEGLARWLGAQLAIADVGRVVRVERTITLRTETAARLATLPPGCYFDTETTGLSTGAGTVIFLAAAARLQGRQLAVRQFLLPDYPDERALLRLVAAELGDAARIVTYNGRAFDLPLLASRLTVHGLWQDLSGLPARHDDLLPVARRLWRRPLGGARLAEIEAGVLGLRRASDCPSAEVPGRWFGYLRGGSPDLLADVLDHNAQDVASLALLEAQMVHLRDGGWRTASVLDHRGMAMELLRAGAVGEALAVLEQALEAADGSEAPAIRRLAARLLVAAGDTDRAEAVWRPSTRRASIDAAIAWIEVARIRERYRSDLPAALEAILSASRILDLAFALGRGGGMQAIGRVRLQVESRRRRLQRRVAAAERRRERHLGLRTGSRRARVPADRRPDQAGGSRYTNPGPPAARPASTATHRPSE